MQTSVWKQLLPLALPAILATCLLPAVWLSAADVQASPAAVAPARLLALARDPTANREVLADVDQATGELTPLGVGLDGCCSTSVLDAALDDTGGTYYAVMLRDGESAPRIMAFDTQTGAATFSPPLTDTLTNTLTGTLAINYLAFDPAANALLALAFDTETLSTQVVRLDPRTGAATFLNTVEDCCNPRAFDAAYDPAARRLYAAVTFYDGSAQTRLLTISGADGVVLADTPLAEPPAINYMAYDGGSDTLWAVVYDAAADAERLARVDRVTGAVTPLGDGAAACCALLVTDAGLDAAAGVIAAPMIDTSDPDPNADHFPRFFRYDLADGALLDSPPVDPDYQLHYIAFAAPLAAQPTGTPTATASATATPTVTGTAAVTPTPTVTRTPLPPRLYLPSLGGSQE